MESCDFGAIINISPGLYTTPRSPNWPKFVSFLVDEEASYVAEAFAAEQRGQTSTTSRNFSKPYMPNPIKKKRSL